MSPKNKATSGTIFEIASHLAVIIFNDGYFVLDKVLSTLKKFVFAVFLHRRLVQHRMWLSWLLYGTRNDSS